MTLNRVKPNYGENLSSPQTYWEIEFLFFVLMYPSEPMNASSRVSLSAPRLPALRRVLYFFDDVELFVLVTGDLDACLASVVVVAVAVAC